VAAARAAAAAVAAARAAAFAARGAAFAVAAAAVSAVSAAATRGAVSAVSAAATRGAASAARGAAFATAGLIMASAAGPAAAQTAPALSSPAARAEQQPPQGPSPAHALVLSGGGARGLAHAGALVALEQLGYDPPLVVGTSMGAIMGALYAAGYEPMQIWQIVTAENWLERLAQPPVVLGPGRVPRRPLLGLGFGRDRAPEGVLLADRVNQRLVELLFDAGVRARNDFDRLPRRYRAVAADLADGAEVVLAAGDLPRAVRASMAVPGAFAPVQWAGRTLVDGGVANNLPVSVARAVARLPVLAVDVGRPPDELSERSAVDVGLRALRLLIHNARPDADAEITVVPRLETGLGESRFPADATRLLRGGYDAVLEQVPPAAAAPGAPPASRPAGDAPAQVAGLRVEGGTAPLRRLVARSMAPATGAYRPGTITSLTAALYGTGQFLAIWPRIEFGDDGAATLVVEITPVAATSAAGAARWDSDVGGGAWAALRHHAALLWPVELHAGGGVSELERWATADASIFSAAFPGLLWNGGAHAGTSRIRLFDGDAVTGTERVRRAGAWLGAERHGDWGFALLARADHVRDAALDTDGWAVGPFLRIGRPPAMDDVVGVEPLLQAEAWLGDVAYHALAVRAGVRRRLSDGAGHAVRTAAFVDVAASSAGTPRDALPAMTRELAPWLPAGALRRRARAAAGLDIAHPVMLEGFARARIRAIAADDEPGHLYRSARWLPGGELGLVWPTVVGTIDVGVAAGRGGGWRVNLGVGPGG
jgi:predicted acylesterase/phospholipase RssA